MMSRALHAFIHDASSVALNICIFLILYQVNARHALIAMGLYLVKSLAIIIYSYEKSKEDHEAMAELERILNMKNNKDDSDV